MDDDEGKNVSAITPAPAADVTGTAEVPDPPVEVNEETNISVANTNEKSDEPKIEESEGQPSSAQEQSVPETTPTETEEAKDPEITETEGTAEEDLNKEAEIKEATEEVKTEEETPEIQERGGVRFAETTPSQGEEEKTEGDESLATKDEDSTTEPKTDEGTPALSSEPVISSEEEKKEVSETPQTESEKPETEKDTEEKEKTEETEEGGDLKSVPWISLKRDDVVEEFRPGQPEGEVDKRKEGLRPDTPDKEHKGEGEEAVKSEEKSSKEDPFSEENAQERSKLIEEYQHCLIQRDTLQQQNAQIQQKLADYFKKKKLDDSRADKEPKNVADLEQRYLKLMAQIEDLQKKQEIERTAQVERTEELEHQCTEKKDRMNADQRKVQEMKRQVAYHAINSRTGKTIPEEEIEQYMANEMKKDTELENVRLENIKLKHKLKKKETQVKSKEELAEGLHLIDFEQLKIENQTYNEKIEERNEELQKFRKKIKSTVEVQTHMKEKLQYVEVENEVLFTELQQIESQVAKKRDELSRSKQMRDALKRNNSALRKNCGLLGNTLLLRNFEDQKEENVKLLDQLEKLKLTFAEYTMQAKHVQEKIDQAMRQNIGPRK